jgi:hypothetical protein
MHVNKGVNMYHQLTESRYRVRIQALSRYLARVRGSTALVTSLSWGTATAPVSDLYWCDDVLYVIALAMAGHHRKKC